jgi:hypothetical protein
MFIYLQNYGDSIISLLELGVQESKISQDDFKKVTGWFDTTQNKVQECIDAVNGS